MHPAARIWYEEAGTGHIGARRRAQARGRRRAGRRSAGSVHPVFGRSAGVTWQLGRDPAASAAATSARATRRAQRRASASARGPLPGPRPRQLLAAHGSGRHLDGAAPPQAGGLLARWRRGSSPPPPRAGRSASPARHTGRSRASARSAPGRRRCWRRAHAAMRPSPRLARNPGSRSARRRGRRPACPDSRQQLVDVKRLGQIAVGARRQQPFGLHRRGVSGDDDHRGLTRS